MNSLDDLGIHCGTDKTCLGHDYLRHYARILEPLRQETFTLLEIGVFNGASLRTWEEYFPRATIVGVDIRETCREFAGGRRVVEIASQADANAMAGIGRKHHPRVVIDDGSHRADHIMITFGALFPMLPPGGIYIVEDVGIAALEGAGVHPEFLNMAGQIAHQEQNTKEERAAVRDVDAVEFIRSAIVVRKRPARRDLDSIRAAVEQSTAYLTWRRFSSLSMKSGATEDAVTAARRAVELKPDEALSHLQLAASLERSGRQSEAVAAITAGLRHAPRNTKLMAAAERLGARR